MLSKNRQGKTLRMNVKIFSTNSLPHELLLTTKQTTKLRNAIDMSTDMKFSKAQISKTIQSGRFLRSLLSKLTGPLMKVANSIAKKLSVPLGLAATMSAIDAGIQKKIHGSGTTTSYE